MTIVQIGQIYLDIFLNSLDYFLYVLTFLKNGFILNQILTIFVDSYYTRG